MEMHEVGVGVHLSASGRMGQERRSTWMLCPSTSLPALTVYCPDGMISAVSRLEEKA